MATIINLTSPEYGDNVMSDINDNFDALNDDLVPAETAITTLQTQISTDYSSTTVKGRGRLSTAPASPTEPIAVGDNDARVPVAGEKAAMLGTSGTPSSTNKFVTETDPNFTGTVKTTGNQSIDGIKTFTSSPVSAADATTDNQAIRKSQADALVNPTSSYVTQGTAARIYYKKIYKTYFDIHGTNTSGTNGLYVSSNANGRNEIASLLGITIASYTEAGAEFGGNDTQWSHDGTNFILTGTPTSNIALLGFTST